MRKRTEQKIAAVIHGAGTVLCLFPTPRRSYHIFYHRTRSANAALQADWDNIGKDIRSVIAKTSPEEMVQLTDRELACQKIAK